MSANASISSLVERQMRNWELARQQRVPGAEPVARPVQPFVSVSRAVGSGGAEVAQALAARIGWPLFDREVMLHMAGDDALRQRLYETMDEQDLSFMEESLRSLLDSEFRRNDYFHRLTETILAVARKGNAVFLGRGADLILPRDVGLRLRIIALPAVCAERYARRSGLDTVRAAREIERIERERAKFVRNHFGVEPASPDRFDLVLNLTALSEAEAVQLICEAMRLRGMMP